MKTLTKILLTTILAITLTACDNGGSTPDETARSENPATSQTAAPDLNEPNEPVTPQIGLDEAKQYLKDNYNNVVIDGSTSMIPLHESLNKLFGNAEDWVMHTTTVSALESLIRHEDDILLSVDYSDELLQKAADGGVKLAKKEITREAFVFLINRNNPVKSLTTEQIKDIYSGKITNWSEVGGDDAPIDAFQRNEDSGSQMRMNKFMGDIKLMEKDVKYYEGMGDIIEAIADYDEGKYSIAYNMYTFTEKQYTNEDVILLEVNGVAPTDETVFDASYPIVIYNYIFYDENNAKAAEFAENLYAFLMSDEGQRLIGDSGYVNLNKYYDRNIDEESRYGYDDYYEGERFDFYNEEKDEFYIASDSGELLVFNSFADYVLRDSKYKDNQKARDFLDAIFNSDLPISPWTASLNAEEGYISVNPWFDASLDLEDFFNLEYGGKYYGSFEYYIDEDKIVLTAISKDGYDSYADYMAPFAKYTVNYEPDSVIEIPFEELSGVSFRVNNKAAATINGVPVNSYSYQDEGLKIELVYVTPFA